MLGEIKKEVLISQRHSSRNILRSFPYWSGIIRQPYSKYNLSVADISIVCFWVLVLYIFLYYTSSFFLFFVTLSLQYFSSAEKQKWKKKCRESFLTSAKTEKPIRDLLLCRLMRQPVFKRRHLFVFFILSQTPLTVKLPLFHPFLLPLLRRTFSFTLDAISGNRLCFFLSMQFNITNFFEICAFTTHSLYIFYRHFFSWNSFCNHYWQHYGNYTSDKSRFFRIIISDLTYITLTLA